MSALVLSRGSLCSAFLQLSAEKTMLSDSFVMILKWIFDIEMTSR